MSTRVWFLYCVNSKICVYTITRSQEEIVSSWERNRNSSALSFSAKFKQLSLNLIRLLEFWCFINNNLLVTRASVNRPSSVTYVKNSLVSFQSFCTSSRRKHRRVLNVKGRSVIIISCVISTVSDNSVESVTTVLVRPLSSFTLRKQSIVITWRNRRGRGAACTNCGQLNEYSTLPTLPYRLPYAPKYLFKFRIGSLLRGASISHTWPWGQPLPE